MLTKDKADKLVAIAQEQLSQGLEAKKNRMDAVKEYIDLYNNKTVEVDAEVFNIPFPYFANFIDTFQAKIDNAPRITFKIPNKATLSLKVQAAWEQEKSSTRAGWNRKDRVEKKQALLSGRAVSKVYASSIGGKYRSHYDIVDVYSFVADPTRGQLEDGNYHGETDIFKTEKDLEEGAKLGFYDAGQIKKLAEARTTMADGNAEVVQNKFARIKSMGVDIESMSFAGQKGTLFTEWVMRYENEWYYLLFEPNTGVWIRAKKLKDIFKNGKTPFVSWATHYDEYSFWSKSLADDVAPVTEAMRFLINNALENEKRRTRPMRMVESGALFDVNELMDFVPDNVILRNVGKDPNLVTVETPEITGTLNLIDFLDRSSQSKTGIQESGVEERDKKVGIYFGQLQQEADRLGVINKEYSESYAFKGYNFFWGLKQHLSKPKQVEMLGKTGVKLQQLDKIEFKDVEDVDDVMVSGGASEDELDAVRIERRLKALKELTAAYPDRINPTWVIETTLRGVEYDEDEVMAALDFKGAINRELMEEADEAIQEIILGETPGLNHGADVAFMQRILNFVRDEMNYIELDKTGKQVGIDKKKKDLSDRLLAFAAAHQEIVIQNNMKKLREAEYAKSMEGMAPEGESAMGEQEGAKKGVDIPPPSGQEGLTRPFESPTSSPAGTASSAQAISQTLSP
jgi:hypothetical protein